MWGQAHGAAADPAVEAFVGVVGPDLAPESGWERGERQDLLSGGVEVVVALGQAADVVEEFVVLGVHGLGVDLLPRPRGLAKSRLVLITTHTREEAETLGAISASPDNDESQESYTTSRS
jgi:hypothetical protein